MTDNSTPAAAKRKITWKAHTMIACDQKSFEMPYPRAAIQTAFAATPKPTAASGHAARKVSPALATKMLFPF
jgi:hypothetical protein